MHSLIQPKKIPSRIVIALWLASFAVVPTAWAVTPAPDGGYPGGNTAEGTNALHNLTSGQNNTAVGLNALYADTTGRRNTALGVQALRLNVAGASNTAVGVNALHDNTHSYNTAVGDSALFNNTTGDQNTATGVQALEANTSGYFNAANGYQALQRNTIGFRNTANGVAALYNNTSGSNNTALGNGAGSGVTTASNVTCIGAAVAGANIPNSCFIGHIYGAMSGFGTAVFVNSSGQLFTINSSQRFKDNIKPMDKASEVLFALKPVTFRYKKEFDPEGVPQFGLVAEDVEKINPDLVVRDADGKVRTVRYEQINAMLLNEFLKEHRRNEQQEATIVQLKKEMETVVARLKEHDSKIQRVNARIEVSKAVGQTALNDQ
jgi:Chaperone of endosialidase